jgi:ribosomal protein S18
MANKDDIKFLSNPKIGQKRKKYCRFRKFGIKYIDYKDGDFLLQFINEQGKILPRRKTCASPGFAALCSRFVEIIQFGLQRFDLGTPRGDPQLKIIINHASYSA